MSTYVMTDSHGHYDPMKRMLDKIGFSAGDRMILAGDYFDVYGIVGNLVEHGMVIAGHTPTTAMHLKTLSRKGNWPVCGWRMKRFFMFKSLQ